MRTSQRIGRELVGLLLVLAASCVLTGCDGSDSSTPPQAGASLLPADPQEWICESTSPTQAELDEWCADNTYRGEPLPEELRNPPPVENFFLYNEYNEKLKKFLVKREYADLGWKHDMHWRLSGPSIPFFGTYFWNYGPHFPLRVHYSPEIIDWLCNGRQGPIPDNAMMVKEMNVFSPTLTIHVNKDDGCMDVVDDGSLEPNLWSPMLKASNLSFDGWYWQLQQPGAVDMAPPQFPPPLEDISAFTAPDFPPPTPSRYYPTGGVLQDRFKIPNVVLLIPLAGQPYCLSCHATAESESTFASLDNLLGKELRYRFFDGKPRPTPTATPGLGAAAPSPFSPFATPLPQPAPGFDDFFNQLEPASFDDVWGTRMPAETYDQQIVSAHGGPAQFITAAQCNACHNATAQTPLLPNMSFIEEKAARASQLRNFSPYGEWRVSPMGLAGRDPIFFAQLESETNRLPSLDTCIETLCLHCHGSMGERQLAIDTPGQGDEACRALFAVEPPPEVPFGQPLRRAVLKQWPGSDENDQQKYGALARDGISCAVCHHISDKSLGEERSYTGNFVTGPADQIFGPYEDDTLATKPMENALGLTPMFAQQIKSSELCGSCHNVLLPVFDNSGQRTGADYEQSTHLEWLNSDSGRPGPDFRSCQGCHMPSEYKGKKLAFKIANSESTDRHAPTTNRLPASDIDPSPRDHYSRHSLHGLNVFLNQFFQQFPLLLGFQQIDWMSEQPSLLDPPAPFITTNFIQELPLFTGFESMLEMAANETATVQIGSLSKTDGELRAVVQVRNLTGHYLPTGVGFRRMFLEFVVRDAAGQALWASGRTNDLGFILDGLSNTVLPSEQPVRFPGAPIQPHYQRIESGSQVQIYQELIEDSDHVLTTSFLHRVKVLKDNRIRPKGFDPAFFAQSESPYIQKLARLDGDERDDDHYFDPALTGSDEVEYRVALGPEALARANRVEVNAYYQSIPPFYLQQRFQDAAHGRAKEDTERLHYMSSHLNIAGATSDSGKAVLDGWKLRITGDMRKVQP